ncbi:unnamed protein product [Adineta steineri]|uniref:Uncharacterized protein n=1 Tax=Adineta steineri TaxID=433720 RepID=A0A818N1S5_9BILA|nr:unnamed protein product [Adineta steineri]CAF3598924.1 unnamed protein product [Adineta steineri]
MSMFNRNTIHPELINSNDEQTPTGQSRFLTKKRTKHDTWEQEGITVAGGQQGYQLHQLYLPEAICIDSNKTIFIAEKKQVIRWFRENQTNPPILISNINCYGLTMDKNGVIYASDFVKHEVRRWKEGDTNATIVAGGNGQGNNLTQFNRPYYIFVDEYYSLYISDFQNHRVMKWEKDTKEGVVVAGGNNQRNGLNQLSFPRGVIVDHFHQIFIVDSRNYRVMRWNEGDTQGSIVVGEHGRGTKAN